VAVTVAGEAALAAVVALAGAAEEVVAVAAVGVELQPPNQAHW
jgi:hypothetical protein